MQTPSLNSIDTIIGHVRGPKGDPGDTSEITVTDITGGHRLTITVGEEEPIVFDVMDGEDGVSPAVTVTNITGGHRVTITDKNHPSGQSFDVMNGTDGTTPAFSIGTVTTGAAGSSASATITGTDAAPVLNLTIPQGLKGDAGNGDMIADDFSTSASYAVGDYVIYSGTLYRFTAAHSAGAWAGTDATAVQLAEDVSDLKSALKSGDEEDAIYHLGFYLDENGDLCQVEEETNNG